MEKLSCVQAKQIELVEYLAFLGHYPQKLRNQDYWYIFPLPRGAHFLAKAGILIAVRIPKFFLG
jgi:hypothetical protein